MVLSVCTIKGRCFMLGSSDELTKLPSEVLYFSVCSEKRDQKKETESTQKLKSDLECKKPLNF